MKHAEADKAKADRAGYEGARYYKAGLKQTEADQTDLQRVFYSIKGQIIQYLEQDCELGDEELKELIEEKLFDNNSIAYQISNQERVRVARDIFNSLRGLGVLQPLLEDDEITEIMVNGYDNIFIEKYGRVRKADAAFENEEALENIIHAIVSRANRSVSEANPIVDARLHDGSRINAVLRPVVLKGPVMTIRKFYKRPMTMKQLEANGSITQGAAGLLRLLVRSRYNILICGGTGSGKTTFLNALSDFIPSHERIITIEDSAELKLDKIENIVSMETRQTGPEGAREVTIRDLIRTSLRMRPERIIVGEVRGPEALDMLQAMNTGHDGSLSTGHANSCKDMLTRLETMVLMAAPIPLEAIRKQIASAVDIIIHLSRMRDGTRKVIEICEIDDVKNGEIILNRLLILNETGIDSGSGKLTTVLAPTGNSFKNTCKLKMAGEKEDICDRLLGLQNEVV